MPPPCLKNRFLRFGELLGEKPHVAQHLRLMVACGSVLLSVFPVVRGNGRCKCLRPFALRHKRGVSRRFSSKGLSRCFIIALYDVEYNIQRFIYDTV